MTIAIIHHPACELHDAGDQHPEQPARVKTIQKALEHYPFNTPVKFYHALQATREQLISIHGEDYVNWIFSIAPLTGIVEIDSDIFIKIRSVKTRC